MIGRVSPTSPIAPASASEAVLLTHPTQPVPPAPHPIRRFGVVTKYDDRPKENFGFIRELGNWNNNPDIVIDRVYFHVTHIRNRVTPNGFPIFGSFCPGDCVEYVRNIRYDKDGNPSYRAVDITGIYETGLPCEHGIVTFMPYKVAHARTAKHNKVHAKHRYRQFQKHHEGGGGTKPDD